MTDNDATQTLRSQLTTELTELRQRRDTLAAGLGDSSDSVSDAGDQADELQRSDELAAVDDQITEVTDRLAGLDTPGDDDTLAHGTRVTVRFDDGAEQTVRIVAAPEQVTDDDSSVTADSPLGRALASAAPGETAVYETPNGSREVEIVSIDRDS